MRQGLPPAGRRKQQGKLGRYPWESRATEGVHPCGRGRATVWASWTPPGHRAPPAPRLLPRHWPLLALRVSPRYGPFLRPLHCSPSSCPVPTAAPPRTRTRLQGLGWAGPSVPGGQTPLPSILSSPANSGPAGWLERVTSSHSPLACASHCEARATRISTSLYRAQGPPVF